MKVKQISVGDMQNFSYIVEEAGDIFVNYSDWKGPCNIGDDRR